jgi:putative ABC transport system permease protein
MVVAVAVVVGLLFSTFVIELGVGRSTEIGSARLGADILLLPAPLPHVIIYIQWKDPVFITPTNTTAHLLYLRPIYINDNGTLDRGIASIPGVASVSPQVFVGSLNYSGHPVPLVGFDPNTDFTILPWLRASGQRQFTMGPDTAVVGSGTGYAVGNVITWRNLSLNVAAVLEPTSSSMDLTVFFPIHTAYQLAQTASQSSASTGQGSNSGSPKFSPGQISALLIKLQANVDEALVGQRISQSISDYVVIFGAIATKQVSLETRGIATYEFFLSGLLGTSVLILIASLMSMSINERRREFGLLRSLGATKLTISRIVMTEAGIVSLVGSLLGLVVGGVVLVVSEFLLTQSYSISFSQPTTIELAGFTVGSLVLGMLIGTTAATYPAYAASRMDPYEAIKGGE